MFLSSSSLQILDSVSFIQTLILYSIFLFYDSTFPTFFLILSDSELLQIQNRTGVPWAPLLACSQTNNPLIARHQNCCDASPSLPLHLRRVMKFKSLIFQLGKCKCKFLWLEWHCPATVMYTIISRSCTASHRYEASSGEHCATTASPRSFKKKKKRKRRCLRFKGQLHITFSKAHMQPALPSFCLALENPAFSLSRETNFSPLWRKHEYCMTNTIPNFFLFFFFFLLKIL